MSRERRTSSQAAARHGATVGSERRKHRRTDDSFRQSTSLSSEMLAMSAPASRLGGSGSWRMMPWQSGSPLRRWMSAATSACAASSGSCVRLRLTPDARAAATVLFAYATAASCVPTTISVTDGGSRPWSLMLSVLTSLTSSSRFEQSPPHTPDAASSFQPAVCPPARMVGAGHGLSIPQRSAGPEVELIADQGSAVSRPL